MTASLSNTPAAAAPGVPSGHTQPAPPPSGGVTGDPAAVADWAAANPATTEPATTEPATTGHPLIRNAAHYAATVLAPRALATEARSVDPARIPEFAQLGLLNHLAPAEFGGAELGRTEDRQLHELIAGACLNTWLVWAQHSPTVGRLAELHRSGARVSELGQSVLRGQTLVGAALSDVRRYPASYIRATRTAAGWEFTGTVSWFSGWGLNRAVTIAAVEPTTETVVTALVPISGEFTAAGLSLSALQGSRTERLRVTALQVPEELVLSTVPLAEHRGLDFSTASDARAHHFGLAQRVLAELAETDRGGPPVAAAWAPRIEALRSQAYALTDEAKLAGDESHRVHERIALKVAVGEALEILTRALVIARAGRGIQADNTAQLHARSALFLLVQGQTTAVRAAQLARLSPTA